MLDADSADPLEHHEEHQNVAIRDDFSVPTAAAVWCAGALVGAAVGLLGFLVFAFVRGSEPVTSLPLPPPDVDDGSVCYSPGCLATADYFRDSLNPLVEPCRNFDDHVCGRFSGPGGSIVDRCASFPRHVANPRLHSSLYTQEFMFSYLKLALTAEQYALTPGGGARHKAATLLRDCMAIRGSRRSQHAVLRQLMQRLNLFLYNPPPGAPTAADDVLALHVELAYVYGLSALLRIRPHAAHSLVVDFGGGALQAAVSRKADMGRWMSRFEAPPRLVVGLPPYADTAERLDAFYASFPKPRGRFLADWLAAVGAWKERVSPADVHFDPLDADVEVATDGTVMVPAALFTVPFYAPDGPAAANVGGLGHLIARRLVRRYLVASADIPAECRSSAGSPTDDVVESVLAYDCVQSALIAVNASDGRRLPRLPSLSPRRILYTVGCLKDCTTEGGRPGGCHVPFRRLKAFDEAFSCASVEPLCLLA
ncbi:hypothetical protein V5799_009697 [Amblyomma americanum]|uniref:Peptidase M13 N-terminal domain-containing protein n=1 Tax=Amblyomma americanum TaxID=6943 RepID=A0AAQ4FBH3_AMBAM